MKTVAIVNPVAGSRRALHIWPRLLQASKAQGLQVTTWWTEAPGHAEVLAARARREGYDRVVAAGGDGTLMEVINGLWWEAQGPKPSVGTVPLGTSCDYLRNFAGGRSLEDKLANALGEATVSISVGRAQLSGRDGQPRQRIFINVMGAGFDAAVVGRFRRLGLPGKIAYFGCGLLELTSLHHYWFTGALNGQPLKTEAVALIAGLGRYFGGGMMFAPGASPQSQLFQVVLGERLSRLGVLEVLTKIYAGKHLDHPQVTACYAKHVKLTADPPAGVEGDGELLGFTPLEIEIIPQALQFAGRLA
jgi:diacylglycerol kinase (ATP)